MDTMTTPPRFHQAQVNRSLVHPTLPQPPTVKDAAASSQPVTATHSFVVAADTQFGMTNENQSWEVEVQYSRAAVRALNAMEPPPLFCCVCGDLVDMTASIYAGKLKPQSLDTNNDPTTATWTVEECDRLQDRQNADFQTIWSDLRPEIALVCVCGNHDVGNVPTAATIHKFASQFGNDYLAFWANGTYNIVLNSNLFSNPTAAHDLYAAQLVWLQDRLQYAVQHKSRHIFVFSHHPWFLYSEDEDDDDLTGVSPFGSPQQFIEDSYFHIPKQYRMQVMALFQTYGVSAAFSGHFHQNLVTTASFGMEMIVTGSLSVVLDSTGNPNARQEAKTQGLRIVHVEHDLTAGGGNKPSTFRHRFVGLSAISAHL
jgi:serine/threonine-protein phosphatase CPPED1